LSRTDLLSGIQALLQRSQALGLLIQL